MNSLGSGYRLFVWPWWKHWFDPGTYYRWMKWKIQRAQRGWADCDVWSLDDYLAEWLPDALLHLKNTKHGIPMTMFEPVDGVDEEGGPSATAMEKGEVRWSAVLDKMIEAFRAHTRICNMDYEKELGAWPQCPCGKVLCDCQPNRRLTSAYLDAMRPLEERDKKLFKEGMALFTEHFGSLWD